MSDDLPFSAEYAKSGRASCKFCKSSIAKDSLRLAKMVQSQHFDGKQPHWFHYKCFFVKNKPKIISDIKGVNELRWDDAQKIKAVFGITSPSASASTPASTASPTTLPALDFADNIEKDYRVEYAKSNRSKCKECEEKIEKLELRLAIMVDGDLKFTSDKIPSWHHVACFKIVKQDTPEMARLQESDFQGFDKLKDSDKVLLKKELCLKKSSKKLTKKAEASVVPKTDVVVEIQMKKQSEELWKIRDGLKRNCKTNLIRELLEDNRMNPKGGESDLLDKISDAIVFGVPQMCPECGNGRLHFQSHRYKCSGHLTGWTKCLYETKKPKRTKFRISEVLFDDCDFLKSLKPKVAERICPKAPNEFDPERPLATKKVLITGKTQKTKVALEKLIGDLGGIVVKSAVIDLDLCVSTADEVQKGSKKIEQLMDRGVPLLSENFVTESKWDNLKEMISKHELVPTVSKPVAVSRKRSGGSFQDLSSQSKKTKLLMKNGAVVDPDSEMQDSTHVYQKKGEIFSAVLGMVDLAKGSNSYYKLQLLEHDQRKKYFIFRSWGRVGTSIGGSKTETCYNLEMAMEIFTSLFEEKTGNDWNNRAEFVKYPYKFYPLEMDYGQEEEQLQAMQKLSGANSKLAIPVQDLIRMIFDVDSMKKTMAEFEIDMNKMPLGKISKRQIEKAYQILGELQKYIDQKASNTKFLDASNRFYTLIPHNFGLVAPPMLDHTKLIKMKMEMLESLLDIEMAYSLLSAASDSDKDPIDIHYERLKADIQVLDREKEEFKKIEEYVKNTHATTHSSYTLEIIDVFTLERQGEKSRYSPFKELHNRKLLWHGSRTSNYAGIIHQGLRIAPPEAPVTGYMFGKGIYFADMVSKSANYCRATPGNSTGLMLLCEVALGNMEERFNADSEIKLPKRKHSCKGCGRTEPDPAMDHVLPDGTVIPLGKGVPTDHKKTSLLYNEYIVYDVAQAHMKYLLKVNFKYK